MSRRGRSRWTPRRSAARSCRAPTAARGRGGSAEASRRRPRPAPRRGRASGRRRLGRCPDRRRPRARRRRLRRRTTSDRARDLDREPRLADSARSRERQHRRSLERIEDLPHLVATADERRAGQRQVSEPRRLQRWEVETEARRDELEKPLGPRNALQTIVSEVAHLDDIAHEVPRGLREHDLTHGARRRRCVRRA